jgi:Fuc2NAc and GlcNAc transferase
MIFFILVVGSLLAFGLTWAYERFARNRGLFDVPNERSSHQVPTPRGGGIAIVIAVVALLPGLFQAGALPRDLLIALCGAGAWTGLVGLVDDQWHFPIRWRLPAQFIGPGWALYWLSGPLALGIDGWIAASGSFAILIAALYSVWLLNLYNFMDGIDGIASIEAVTVSFGAGALYLMALPETALWAVPILVLAAASGFLYWNYPPARIFMGDVGSGFLGVTFAVLSLHAGSIASELCWAWVILLGVFIVDATTTLCRLLLRRNRPHEAHRSHAYQYAARRLGGHKPVSLLVGAINLLWLCPIALWVGTGRGHAVVGLAVAYLPLLWLAFHLKAGAPELQAIN